MNTQILKAIQPVILEHAHEFLMSTYVASRDSWHFKNAIKEPEKNDCGTAGCIAYWIVKVHDKKDPVELLRRPLNSWTSNAAEQKAIQRRAEEILALEEPPLFGIGNWPNELAYQFRLSKTDRQRAEIAVQAIQRYIDHPEDFD